MLKVYLDNCCYSRPFDDLSQEKVNLEEEAIESILNKSIKNELEIYTSIAIDFEISKIRDINKKGQIEDLYDAMLSKNIEITSEIISRAEELKKYNIKVMDALHISFAESANVDYVITTDKNLLNGAKRANLKTKVVNPIEFIMEVV